MSGCKWLFAALLAGALALGVAGLLHPPAVGPGAGDPTPLPARAAPAASAIPVTTTVAASPGTPDPAPAATPAATAVPAPVVRPNIVLIIGDDHGYPHYGFMGHPQVQTPAMDRLAGQGALFPVCHNSSPACMASLESILVGLYPKDFATGRHDRVELTLPNVLRRAGYRSFGFGKFWTGFAHRGFDEYRERSKMSAGRRTMQPIYDFIDRHRERFPDQPFFVWYAPRMPHTPHNAAARFERPYAEMGLDRETSGYFAMITWMDETVMDLANNLHRRGLLDRTLLLYVADNGYGLPHAKHCFTENGFRTVLWARLPGSVRAGQVRSEQTSTIDILPTFLDYAGLEIPAHLEGRSLRPLLEGREIEWREYLFGQGGAGSAKRQPPGQRYLRTPDGLKFYADQNRLYDLNADPNEERNLIGDPRFAELIPVWRRAINAWSAHAARPERGAGSG